MFNRRFPGLVFAAALTVAGCEKTVTVTPAPTNLGEAMFDPSAVPPVLPTPTNLARSAKTGLLTVPVANALKDPTLAAQADFDRYLNSLDGYPTAATATVKFSEELDAASIFEAGDATKPRKLKASAVLVLKLGAKGAATKVADVTGTVTKLAKGSQLNIIAPKGGWTRGGTYAFFVKGGANGAKTKVAGKDATSVTRSALFELAASERPLCEYDATAQRCTHNYAALVRSVVAKAVRADPANAHKETEELDRLIEKAVLARATTFEQLRVFHDGILKAATANGFARKEVVVAWSFSVVGMAMADFDPSTGVIPQPANDLLINQASGKVEIPAQAGDTATDLVLKAALGNLDGFSLNGPMATTFSAELDAKTAKLGDILLLDLKSGQAITDVDVTYFKTSKGIVVQPSQPLKEKQRYAVVMLSRFARDKGALKYERKAGGGLTDDKGDRVVASPTFALARSRHPLVKDVKCMVAKEPACTSNINIVPDNSVKLLEQLRRAYAPLFAALELLPADKAGRTIKREDIVQAWTFTTQTVTEPATKLRSGAYTALAGDKSKPMFTGTYTTDFDKLPKNDKNLPATLPEKTNLAGFVDGLYDTAIGVDLKGQGFLQSDPKVWTKAKVKFFLFVPKGTAPTTGWPVVIFGHGFTGSRTHAYDYADLFASAGFATIAYDKIYHGGRSWCLTDADCKTGGKCTTSTGQCSLGFKVDSRGNETASGNSRFLNTANPFALRDNFRQEVIDMTAMTRALALGAEAGITATPAIALDEKKISYMGVSLGAIMGTMITSLDSSFENVILSVGGGPFAVLGFESIGFKNLVDAIFKARNITRGSLGEKLLLATFQWIADPADPSSFARHVKTTPLIDQVKTTDPKKPVMVNKKNVLFIVAGNDTTVPTKYQTWLAKAMSVDVKKSTYAGQGHGLTGPKGDPSPDASKAARKQITNFLKTGKICTPNATAGTCI